MSSEEEDGAGIDLDADGSRLMKRHLDDAAEYEGEEDEQEVILPEQKIKVFQKHCRICEF